MVIEVYNSVQGAAFFQRLLQEWRKTGAQVETHQAISEADYRARRGLIGRLLLRWRMYIAYAWVCWRGAEKDCTGKTLRVVTTNPFFAPALVRWTAGQWGMTINLLYDLFPEALIQAGSVKDNSFIARRCADITRFSIRECATTVFLGERLRAYAELTYGVARRAVVIPVGADGTPFRNSPPMLLPDEITPQILYSGQMGSMHEIETLLSAWPDLSDNIRWAFYASGSGYARLCRSVSSRENVAWGESLSEDKWQHAMKHAQVALVTIAPGAEKVVMPSKTYSALVAGQAILAICRRSSDLADLVSRHDCGWVVEPGDVAGLHRVLFSIANSRAELWTKRKNSFEAGHRYYDMTPVAAEWVKLFAELESGSPVSGAGRSSDRAA
jgi:colanic acid biosynthesis glycosyl transferase WcaI